MLSVVENPKDMIKLNYFDESNFTRWKDMMTFFFTTLRLFNVIGPSLYALSKSSQDDIDEIKVKRKKYEEDELLFHGHNLSTLTGHLYDLYLNVKSPR